MKLEDAICLAAQAHRGQSDRSDEHYIRHCLRVMELLAPDEEAMVVGVLHDLLEDTSVRALDDLRGAQFRALELLTRGGNDEYEDYIERLCLADGEAGNLARRVKMADIADNLRRNPSLHEPARTLLRGRYQGAQAALRQVQARVA